MTDPLATGPYRPDPPTAGGSPGGPSSDLSSRAAAVAGRLRAGSDTAPADTGTGRTAGVTAPAPGVPAAVAGYELGAVLGRGGMGVVYRARQVGLNRDVALKMVLGPGRADGPALARFLAEAVAAVRHPHVVGVYDYGEADGRPYPWPWSTRPAAPSADRRTGRSSRPARPRWSRSSPGRCMRPTTWASSTAT